MVKALGRDVPGLRAFPQLDAVVENPSTQHALWLWLRGAERGELFLQAQALEQTLAPALRLVDSVDGFLHRGGHDLSGYEDGTENPVDDDAVEAAIVASEQPGLAGSSFAAFQLWKHDLNYFKSLPQQEQDNIIGRRMSDNEELDDAPHRPTSSAPPRKLRPEAFVVRRSVAWADERGAGLAFVALGHSLDAFEVQLRRMSGLEDGIIDGLYRFSRPLTGGYYWCPPMGEAGLDLSLLLQA